MSFAPQRRALFRDLNFQKWSEPLVFFNILTSKSASRHNGVHFLDIATSKSRPTLRCFVHFDLKMCFAPQRRALFQHLNFQKVVREWCVLYILTSKCASRHNGVHFFNIWTSKSGPTKVCFVHFDLEMCFALQRRALFRHCNFQKCFDHGVFCTFWLGNVLRATTACNFPSLIWPAGSAPAALASLLFDLRGPKSLEKHSVLRLSYLFPRLHLLSSYSFSSTLLSSNLSLLSALPCSAFSSVHIVGSLTF